MLKIFTYSLGELGTNCYVVSNKKECLIIDPADSSEFIAEKIQEKNLTPKFIIATHGHFDHILGAVGLKLIFDIPFLINEADKFLVENMKKSGEHWLRREIKEPTVKIDGFLKDGEELKIGDEIFEIIETPGHTPGGICLYSKNNKIIFTGDLLFKGGIGRYDFSYSSGKLLKESLNKIMNLPSETAVYSGHGEPITIGEEKFLLYNKYKL